MSDNPHIGVAMVFSLRSIRTGATLVCVLLSVHSLLAQGMPVEIRDVSFRLAEPYGGGGDWYEVSIEIAGTRDASGVDLDLGIDLACESVREGIDYTFFRSEVTIAPPEPGDKVIVFFYLPPGVVEREGLRREPFGWRVRLSEDGRSLPQAAGTYSDSLASPQAARSFAARLEQEAGETEGWLQPIYLTPFFAVENGRLIESPSYRRRSPSTGSGGGQ